MLGEEVTYLSCCELAEKSSVLLGILSSACMFRGLQVVRSYFRRTILLGILSNVAFIDFFAVDKNYSIGPLQRVRTVGNDDGGYVLQVFGQIAEKQFFGECIKR